MNARRRIATAALSILLLGVVASAVFADCDLPNGSTAGWLTWYKTNATNGDCRLYPGANTLVIEVRAIPFQKIKFTLPDPPFGTVTGEQWFFPHTGTRQTGIELDTGCTTVGTVTLGEISLNVDYNIVSPTVCASWGGSAAQLQNCTGRWLPAAFQSDRLGGLLAQNCLCTSCWQCAYTLQPYNLYPPDGATNVPLDAKFSWEGMPSLPYPYCRLYITRDPTCATGQEIVSYPSNCGAFDPGPLSPNTTYYWRPFWNVDDGWGSQARARNSFIQDRQRPVGRSELDLGPRQIDVPRVRFASDREDQALAGDSAFGFGKLGSIDVQNRALLLLENCAQNGSRSRVPRRVVGVEHACLPRV